MRREIHKIPFLLGLLTILAIAATARAYGQVVSLEDRKVVRVATFNPADPISKFFEQIDGEVARLQRLAEETGNGLLAQAGTELDVAEQNLRLIVQEEHKALFKDLSEQTRVLIQNLNTYADQVRQLADDAYKLEAISSIDFEQTIGRTLPWVKESFVLKRIVGLTQMKTDDSYKIHLLGTNLGTGRNDVKVSVTLYESSPSGKLTIVPVEQVKSAQHECVLEIPSSLVNPVIRPESSSIFRFLLDVDYKYLHSSFFGLSTDWKKIHAQYQLRMTVMPDMAGSGEISTSVQQFGWVQVGGVQSRLNQTPDWEDNFRRTKARHLSIFNVGPVPINHRLFGSGFVPAGGPTEFSEYKGWYNTDDAKYLHFAVEVWSKPMTFKLLWVEQEWKQTGSVGLNIPFKFDWNSYFEVRVPKAYVGGQLSGTLVTKQKFQLGLDEPAPPDSPLKIVKKQEDGDWVVLGIRSAKPGP